MRPGPDSTATSPTPVPAPAPIVDAQGPDPRPAATDVPPPGIAEVNLAVDGSHAVEWLHGDIDVASARQLSEVGARALADPTVTELTLDFSGVRFLDSAGLGAVIQLRTKAKAADKALTLRGVAPATARVFHLTGTAQLFGLDIDDPGRC